MPDVDHPLDNPLWGALTSHHAALALGAGGVRRYPAEVAPFAASDHAAPLDPAALAARFEVGPAPAVVAALLDADEQFDAVLLDPPRTGAKDVVDLLAATGARRIVYVSCDPATFARDGERLVAAGFAPQVIAPFDLMPQTAHVELVATFARRR